MGVGRRWDLVGLEDDRMNTRLEHLRRFDRHGIGAHEYAVSARKCQGSHL